MEIKIFDFEQIKKSIKKEDLKIGFDKHNMIVSVFTKKEGLQILVKDKLPSFLDAEEYIKKFDEDSKRDDIFVNPYQRKKIHWHSGIFELYGKLFKPKNESCYLMYKMNYFGEWEYEKDIEKIQIDF